MNFYKSWSLLMNWFSVILICLLNCLILSVHIISNNAKKNTKPKNVNLTVFCRCPRLFWHFLHWQMQIKACVTFWLISFPIKGSEQVLTNSTFFEFFSSKYNLATDRNLYGEQNIGCFLQKETDWILWGKLSILWKTIAQLKKSTTPFHYNFSFKNVRT